MKRSTRRLILLLAALPVAVVLIGTLYMEAMTHLEGSPRDFWSSLEWAAETLTTTGYGSDTRWKEPLMVMFVILAQFLGLFLVFLLFPVYVIPFFEERFEARLPAELPAPEGERYVLIYRYGPAVSVLIDELVRYGRRVLVLEEDEDAARSLHEKGLEVVRNRRALDELRFDDISHAEAIVANGRDHDNAALLLIVRDKGFEGPVYALVNDPLHRRPLITWGATAVDTPAHVLALALASRASRRIRPAIPGVQQLGEHVGVAELRIHRDSPLVGEILAQARLRDRHGVVVLGQWHSGRFFPRPLADTPLSPGDIIVAVGREPALESLSRLAVPLVHHGPIVIAGFGEVGRQVQEMLTTAGEKTVTIDQTPTTGVDIAGNALDWGTLKKAGVRTASAVVLTLGNDSEALFAATVIREFAPDVPLIARVNQPHSVHRLYRVGADLALSIGQVAGQLLAQHLLGEEYISLEQDLKLVKVDASGLVGRHPLRAGVRERTGCQVVAIERGGDVLVEFAEDCRVAATDAVFVAGSQKAIDAYYSHFRERHSDDSGAYPGSAHTSTLRNLNEP